MVAVKLTPQLVVGLVAMIILGGLGFAGRIDGSVTLSSILSIAGGFGLGAYHEANGGGPDGA